MSGLGDTMSTMGLLLLSEVIAEKEIVSVLLSRLITGSQGSERMFMWGLLCSIKKK